MEQLHHLFVFPVSLPRVPSLLIIQLLFGLVSIPDMWEQLSPKTPSVVQKRAGNELLASTGRKIPDF